MKRLFLLLLISNIFAQVNETSGHLIKINFNDPYVSTSDSLLSWYTNSNGYSHFYKTFKLNGSQKLLNISSNQLYPLAGGYYVVDEKTGKSQKFSDPVLDIFPIYSSNEKITNISNGVWFNFDVNWGFFLTNSDSIKFQENTSSKSLVHIIGKFNNSYLIVYLTDNYSFEYGFSTLENSPDFEITQELTIEDSEYFKPTHLEQIDSHKVIMADKNSLKLYNFKDTSFAFDSQVSESNFSHWTFLNRNLYLVLNQADTLSIVKSSFDENLFGDFKQVYQRKINSNLFNIDEDCKNLLFSDNDSLFVYNIENESLIRKWDISHLDQISKPLIDSPFVFIHKTTKLVSTGKFLDNIPKSFELTAYPNPFNPQTTIEYNLPQSGNVKIEVFNFTGEKICTLFNEKQSAGNYKLNFNAENLASGIYICRIIFKNKSLNKKLILLK